MNSNDNHLSLGNIIRIIKENSSNKKIATQSEIFSIIFGTEQASDTTINNYCVGYRSIGDKYKLLFKKLSTKEMLKNFIYIIDFAEKKEELISQIYNLSKNDEEVSELFLKKLNDELKNFNNFMTLVLNFAVLEKKQPQYVEEQNKISIQKYLYSSLISSDELEIYLDVKFNEGVNIYYSLLKLANKNNAYASFDLGMNEYKKNNIYKSIEYFKKAANKKHPGSMHMLARMYLKINYSESVIIKLLDEAIKLGNIGAINTKGLMHLNKKDYTKATILFKEAAKNNYSYAFNNLGLIEEKNNNHKDAFHYFLSSSKLGNNWASNRIGEYYRKGIYVKKNKYKAYNYYKKSIQDEINNNYFYGFYNLAKHYYLCGFNNIKKDLTKAIEYLKLASSNNIIEASEELLYIYTQKYLETNNYKYKIYIDELIVKIENDNNFNENYKKIIEKNLKLIKNKITIKKAIIFD